MLSNHANQMAKLIALEEKALAAVDKAQKRLDAVRADKLELEEQIAFEQTGIRSGDLLVSTPALLEWLKSWDWTDWQLSGFEEGAVLKLGQWTLSKGVVGITSTAEGAGTCIPVSLVKDMREAYLEAQDERLENETLGYLGNREP